MGIEYRLKETKGLDVVVKEDTNKCKLTHSGSLNFDPIFSSYGLINSAKLKQYKTIVILGCTNDSLLYKDSKVLPGIAH